jgi:hypothetical protein
VPETGLTVPVLAAFTVMLVHFLLLYKTRVGAPFFVSIGAAFSAMALQLTVGRAVAEGIIKDKVPFLRTAKGSRRTMSERFPAFWEALLGASLLLASISLYVTNEPQARAIYLFAAVIAVQSLPFIAAVAITLFERSSLNEFATWRRIAALATYRPRLPRGRAPTSGAPGSGGVGILP